jgi:hypothetical protein
MLVPFTLQCCEVLEFLAYKRGAVDVQLAVKRAVSAGIESSEAQMKPAINALTYTLREAVRTQASADELATGLRNTGGAPFP